jgi:hypothetical protein
MAVSVSQSGSISPFTNGYHQGVESWKGVGIPRIWSVEQCSRSARPAFFRFCENSNSDDCPTLDSLDSISFFESREAIATAKYAASAMSVPASRPV